ncbi:MAG: helix-turn-helix domain-containing protein [Candidatus Methanoperedens sp.]|nr:helix-turn-helix domain-containing protein [Candidatus Methanoperedens sp.]
MDDRSKLTYATVRRVAGMTRAGGNPFNLILRQQGAKEQYSLLMTKYKIMGIDRPTVRRWHALTMEDRKNIVEDYASGMPVKDIMVKYQCADTQIYRCMKILETNIPKRCKSKFIREEDRDTILKMYESGKSATKIGRALNRHHSVVRRIIMETTHRNLSHKKFVRLSDDEKTKLKMMFAQGTNCTEIAKLTGHSKTTVRKIADDSPMKHHKTFSEADRENLREAFKEGLSLRKTAMKFNSNTSSVKFWFDKFKRGL